jgi:RNA polymerase sigma-70 factor (ECF subfamily)
MQREILTLFFLEDMSLTDIAEVLGVSIGTAKSRLHYSKKALRTSIANMERNDEHGP